MSSKGAVEKYNQLKLDNPEILERIYKYTNDV